MVRWRKGSIVLGCCLMMSCGARSEVTPQSDSDRSGGTAEGVGNSQSDSSGREAGVPQDTESGPPDVDESSPSTDPTGTLGTPEEIRVNVANVVELSSSLDGTVDECPGGLTVVDAVRDPNSVSGL